MFPASTKDNITSDTKNGVNRVKDELRQTASDLHSDLESAATRAGRKVREVVDTTSGQITDAADSLTTQIRSKPVQSSLMALAAGFVIGALFRR